MKAFGEQWPLIGCCDVRYNIPYDTLKYAHLKMKTIVIFWRRVARIHDVVFTLTQTNVPLGR